MEFPELEFEPSGSIRPIILDGESLCAQIVFGDKPMKYLLKAVEKFVKDGHRPMLLLTRKTMQRICDDHGKARRCFEFLKSAHMLVIVDADLDDPYDQFNPYLTTLVKETYLTGALLLTNNPLELVFDLVYYPLCVLQERIIAFCWMYDRLTVALQSCRSKRKYKFWGTNHRFNSGEKVATIVNALGDDDRSRVLVAIKWLSYEIEKDAITYGVPSLAA